MDVSGQSQSIEPSAGVPVDQSLVTTDELAINADLWHALARRRFDPFKRDSKGVKQAQGSAREGALIRGRHADASLPKLDRAGRAGLNGVLTSVETTNQQINAFEHKGPRLQVTAPDLTG